MAESNFQVDLDELRAAHTALGRLVDVNTEVSRALPTGGSPVSGEAQPASLANLDDEMATIADRCAAFSGQYGTPYLLIPLPPTTDVHAPGYTYDDLRSADLPPGPAVDAAVRDHAARTAPPDGRISRALDPDR